MANRRELDSLFSWVPPRSTVVNVSPRGSPLSRTRTHSNKPRGRLHTAINSPKQTEMGRKRRTAANLSPPGPFREVSNSKLIDENSDDGIYETLDLARNNRMGVVDEDLLKEEKINEAESGLEMWFEMIKLLDEEHPKENGLNRDGLHATPNHIESSGYETNTNSITMKKLAEEFARRKSVFAFQNIGKNAVDVESMLKSRKESESNPSSKFLTMSFQNNEENGDKGDTVQDGVMYAKNVKPKERMQPGSQATKTEQQQQQNLLSHDDWQTKAKQDDIDSVKSETDPTSLTWKKLTNDFARRKSVFAFDNIGKTAVDVEKMLKSRKGSEDSPSSKFLTMSFQNSEGGENEGDTVQDGVMYAKTVTPKEQPGNRTTKTMQPEQEHMIEEIENEKKRKSGKNKSKKDKKKKPNKDT